MRAINTTLMPKLKVFRTAIGFHDAYVAVPSMKAALEAWGAGSNLFAQGLAEAVTDPALSEVALAKPGQVIKVARGSDAQHLAALGSAPERSKTKTVKPKPRPSRAALDAAEKRLAALEKRHAKARAALEAKQKAERAAAEADRDKAMTAYNRAMKQWHS